MAEHLQAATCRFGKTEIERRTTGCTISTRRSRKGQARTHDLQSSLEQIRRTSLALGTQTPS
jgi:hypothetical protein